MKKIYFVLFAFLATLRIQATSFTISISGFAYTPATSTVNVGDVITIQASSTHPLNQVDATVWTANGSTTLTSGWGTKTADYTFTVSTVGTIYFVCQNHVSMGMKGSIVVNGTSGLYENTLVNNNFELFPNPAIENISIKFSLNNETTLNAKLFNVLGQEAAVLIPSSSLSKNDYMLDFNIPSALPAGTYFAVITINNERITKKIIISK